MLPRSLKRLALSFKQIECDISNQHFEGLPETLQQIYVGWGTKVTFDAKVFASFRKTLVDIEGFEYPASDPAVEKATREFLNKYPLLEGVHRRESYLGRL